MILKAISCLLLSLGLCSAQTELLKNPGFESGATDWLSDAFTMVAETTDVHGGQSAALCTDRTDTWQGPAQDTNVKPGGSYVFGGFVKLVDKPGLSPQTFMVKIAFDWKDGSETDYFSVSERQGVTAQDGWVDIGSQFNVPNQEYSRAKLYVEGPEADVEYYVDDMSLKEASGGSGDWESEANQRIEDLRKSNIHFDFNVPGSLNKDNLEVHIDHVRHLFGFGSLVFADYMIDPDFEQYQNIVYHMFNYATLQEYKWRYDRGTKDNPDFSAAVAATDALNANGLKVRGHCMFWEVAGHVPDWANSLKGQDLINAVDDHIEYMTSITKGKLAHWDVDNEILHGDFFKSGTGDPDFPYHMFREVHSRDPDPILFLNDYNVVGSGGWSTQAYLDQINQFKAANVGLGAAGIQSHMPPYTPPNPDTMKARLDTLAKAGVPMWVTELELSADNEATGADWYEDILRLYFSYPLLEGVIFWGFWGHEMDPDGALVNGYSYTLSEQGKRFLKLTKEEWSTHEVQSLSDPSFDLRGFQGDYEATIYYNGKPIQRSEFSVGKDDTTVSIDINSDGSEITLPVKADPFAKVPVTHETTSDGLQTLGQASSSSSSSSLQCVTRRGQPSAVADDEYSEVSCESGEVLTSCTSYLDNNDWHRDGEQFVVNGASAACRAYNGYGTSAGVRAVARCCQLQGLSCTYKSAGPSGTGVDDQVIVPCSDSGVPLGCATHTYQTDSDGADFTADSCIGQNDNTVDGVYSYAACCQASSLQCEIARSAPGGQNPGDMATVECPAGKVMTGCNVYTPYARAAGAFVQDNNGKDQCVAVNGDPKYGDETGVEAVATCCSA